MTTGDDLAASTARFLAGLRAAAADPALRAALALGPASRVLVVGSEGDTDPAIYRGITGRSAAQMRGV
jgi:diaminopropionate ammonia-lyase